MWHDAMPPRESKPMHSHLPKRDELSFRTVFELPNASSTKLSTPLCVIVGVDDVRLPDGKTFFPGGPEKSRWVPIFRSAPVVSQTDDNITREQFPLTLAWALTH